MASLRKILIPLAAVAALATPAPAAADPGEIVVRLEGESRARVVEVQKGTPAVAARAIAKKPGVAYAVPNYVATASALLPNDPGTPPGQPGRAAGWTHRQWNFLPCGTFCGGESFHGIRQSLGGINAVEAWQNLRRAGRPGARGVTVAVLDTGIAYRKRKGLGRRSPDFRRSRFVPGHDFVDNDRYADDTNGHGTHVAGTVGEQTNNDIGLTGLAYRAKLMPVRVLNRAGKGDSDDIARGIRFAARHGADVINMSFNFDCNVEVPVVREALRFAHRSGAVLVASSGNLGCVSYPAGVGEVVTVGGTTSGGCRGVYSPTDIEIDVLAPGGGSPVPSCEHRSSRPVMQITLKRPGTRAFGTPRWYSGTSMAAAHVSGVAAMVLASGVLGPGPSPERVAEHLQRTARSLGMPRAQQGAGIVDAAAATDPG